jgi:hypothetical protein
MPTPSLTVDGQALEVAGALHVESYDDIYAGTPLKGRDRPMPAAAGSRAYPRYTAALVCQFQLWVYGEFALNGTTPHSDTRQGIIDNAKALPVALGIPTTTGPVVATFTEWDGGTLSADVHPSLSRFRTLGTEAGLYVLELEVPGGVWA